MNNQPALAALPPNQSAPGHSLGVRHFECYQGGRVADQLDLELLGHQMMKGRSRAWRAFPNRGEDFLKMPLNRFSPVKSTGRFRNRKEDGRIFGEELDEALHIKIFERAKKLIGRLSDLPLFFKAILSGTRCS